METRACEQCGGVITGAVCPECLKRVSLRESEIVHGENAESVAALLPGWARVSHDAAAKQSGEPGQNGEAFGDYLLLQTLGQGAMGTVFKARHKRLNRLVALKLIRH